MLYKKLNPFHATELISDEAISLDNFSIPGRTFVGDPEQVKSILNLDWKIISNPVEAYDLLTYRQNERYPQLEPLIIYLKNGFNTFFTGVQDPLFRMPMALNVIYVYEKPDISAHGGLDLRNVYF
jgi:hypothetical protein